MQQSHNFQRHKWRRNITTR